MNAFRKILFSISALVSFSVVAQNKLINKLENYSQSISTEISNISADRKAVLMNAVNEISSKQLQGKVAIIFLSKDNSAASQLAQAWLHAAIYRNNLKHFEVFSAGDELRPISDQAICLLSKAGFKVDKVGASNTNPKYALNYSWKENSILMFSKKRDNYQIPTSNQVLIATDNSINEVGVNLSYSEEVSKKESRQIAAEMFFIAEQIQRNSVVTQLNR